MNLTVRQKKLIREGYEALGDLSGPTTMLFYGRLFQLDPSLRALFSADLRAQSAKMAEMLDGIVAALDQGIADLAPPLAELGRRHRDYGVQPEHYELVRSAFLWALAQALDAEFDAEARTAWNALLDAVSRAMLDGAAQA